MAVSKILIDGVGIDLTNDTCDYDNMLAGVKAHMNDGEPVTGSIPSKSAATYTPSLSAQTIAAGQYLSGKQTISAITKELLANLDADFVAGNIKKDVNLFGLVGTLEGGGGGGGDPIDGYETHYGTFTPASDVTTYTIDTDVDTSNGNALSSLSGFAFLCFRDPSLLGADRVGLVSITAARVKRGSTLSVSGSAMNAYGILNTNVKSSNLSVSLINDANNNATGLRFTISGITISSETYFWILLRKRIV